MLDLRKIITKNKKQKENKMKKTAQKGDVIGANTISCSLKLNSYSNDKTMKQLNHNMRLTWQASVVEEKKDKAFLILPPKEEKLQPSFRKLSKVKEQSEKIRKEMPGILYDLEKHNKDILNDPKNMDNFDSKNNRRRGQSQFKHNLITEAVIHIGSGSSKLLTGNNQKPIQLALDNFKSWLKEMSLRENIYFPVLHQDEEGESHIHLFYSSSNPMTGKKINMRKADLSLLQDKIADSMEQYGLRRGENWDINPATKKRGEEIHEYKNRQERIKKAATRELELLNSIKKLEADEKEAIEKMDLINENKEKLIATLEEESTGDFLVSAILEKIDKMKAATYGQDLSPDEALSFQEKLMLLKGAIRNGMENGNTRKAAGAIVKVGKVDKAIKKIVRKNSGPKLF